MENIAVHMRVSGVSVGDDDVNSRLAAANSLATTWGKETTVSKLISKAAKIAEALSGDGTPSPELGAEVQKAIQKKSSSYLYEERPLEVGVCAGMAMVSIISAAPGISGYQTADVYAAALWSAIAYQPVLDAYRRENLRREVLEAAFKRSELSAEKARERSVVPDPADVEITVTEDEITHNITEAMAKTVEALRRNATLDREELDFLWWAQLGRSRLLNKQLSAIAEPTRIVAAGIEGAKLLRRLPCDVHREIVLRTLENDPEFNLEELLAAIGDDREVLGCAFTKGVVADNPSVFPLLHALATGLVDGPGAAVKRRVSEWGERALLEAGFAKLITNGPAKL